LGPEQSYRPPKIFLQWTKDVAVISGRLEPLWNPDQLGTSIHFVTVEVTESTPEISDLRSMSPMMRTIPLRMFALETFPYLLAITV
jgi:hypothetical protein